MSRHAVHWSEGMLLRPQHFQAAQRFFADQTRLNSQWDNHYGYGLRHFDLDPEALAAGQFKVRSLAARLRDGTVLLVPDDGELPDLDLQAALAGTGKATVSLALPTVNLARANANDDTGRYVAYLPQEPTADENTGQSGKPVQYRKFNLKLITDDDDPTGYEVLPLARVERPAQGGGTLDLHYIPPILACDAWQPLRDEVLNQIHYRLGAEQRELQSRVNDRNIGFGGASAEEARFFAALRVVNEAQLVLQIWSAADGRHPFDTYLELVRLVGRLAIFDPKEPLPDLPPYNHDDLGTCFLTAKKHINRLLDKLKGGDGPGGGYLDRAFRGNEQRLEVQIDPAWLAPAWQLFVGVSSNLRADQLRQLLEQADKVGGRGLAMKLGSADKVDGIWANRMKGLGFEYVLQKPPALPPQYVYFKIRREEQDREWNRVTETLQLGLRLSETAILSNIQGMSQVPIRIDSQTTATMEFRLFILPPRRG